jgi:hypothetical protein
MGTAGKMSRAQQAVQKAATLAEAQTILKGLQDQEQEVTDTFFTQEATIDSLTDLIKTQDQQVTYISPPAPTPQRSNYVLYIALGVVALFMFGKVKL